MRDPLNKTTPLRPRTKYPGCTLDGTTYCDVKMRNKLRGNVSNLPEKVLKHIKPEYLGPRPKAAAEEEKRSSDPIVNT
jgi:hypothetical protein